MSGTREHEHFAVTIEPPFGMQIAGCNFGTFVATIDPKGNTSDWNKKCQQNAFDTERIIIPSDLIVGIAANGKPVSSFVGVPHLKTKAALLELAKGELATLELRKMDAYEKGEYDKWLKDGAIKGVKIINGWGDAPAIDAPRSEENAKEANADVQRSSKRKSFIQKSAEAIETFNPEEAVVTVQNPTRHASSNFETEPISEGTPVPSLALFSAQDSPPPQRSALPSIIPRRSGFAPVKQDAGEPSS